MHWSYVFLALTHRFVVWVGYGILLLYCLPGADGQFQFEGSRLNFPSCCPNQWLLLSVGLSGKHFSGIRIEYEIFFFFKSIFENAIFTMLAILFRTFWSWGWNIPGKVNTMAADDLASYVARSSAAMILIVYNLYILVSFRSEFQQLTMF